MPKARIQQSIFFFIFYSFFSFSIMNLLQYDGKLKIVTYSLTPLPSEVESTFPSLGPGGLCDWRSDTVPSPQQLLSISRQLGNLPWKQPTCSKEDPAYKDIQIEKVQIQQPSYAWAPRWQHHCHPCVWVISSECSSPSEQSPHIYGTEMTHTDMAGPLRIHDQN